MTPGVRARRLALAALAATLCLAAPASAYFTTTGTGGVSTLVASLTGATVSVPASAINNVTVTWASQGALAPSVPPADLTISYRVQRKLGAGAYANVSSGPCSGVKGWGTSSCIDTPGAAGSYTYRIVSTYATTWTATSADAGPTAVTLDSAAPGVSSITRAGISPTNAASVSWTVTFSEGVTGVDASDFALAATGPVNGTSISSVTGSGATRTVTANTGTSEGMLGLNLVDDDTIVDLGANQLGGTGAGNGNFTGEVYSVDTVAPTATITRSASNPTNASSVTWLVSFSETVSGVDAADFSLVRSGVTGGSITSVSGTGSTRTVTATTGTGDGTLGLNLVPDGTIKDFTNNTLTASSTGQLYTMDRTAPALSALQMFDVDLDGRVDRVTATFNEALASSTLTSQWTLANVPSAGTLASVSTSGSMATLTLNEGANAVDTAVGSFTVALAANASGIRDAAGNQASFTATAPADKASPVLIAAGDNDQGSGDGKIETNNYIGIQFSELVTGGIPSTVTITEARPASGNVTLTITGFTNGALDMGSTNYLSQASTTVNFTGTTTTSAGNVIAVGAGTCTSGATACGRVAAGTGAMTFTAATTLTDATGNPAVGSVTFQGRVF